MSLSNYLACLRHRLRLLRLRPFDESTEEGRSDERLRRVAMTALVSLGARGLSAAVALLSVPLTISYLGTERYGVWLTVSSLVAMMSFADLGIGNGLTTKVAEAQGRGDGRRLNALISSAAAVLSLLALLFSALLILTAPLADWGNILNVKDPAANAEAVDVIVVLGLLFFGAMPFAIVQRVQNGLQEGYSATLWTAAGSLLSLLALLITTHVRAGLVPLVLALSGAPLAVALVNSFWFFGFKRPDLRPRFRIADPDTAWDLLRTGLLFVVLQLAVSFAYTSDNLVLGTALGAIAVPLLAVPAKLFGLVQQFVGVFTAPLWPAFGEATARGDTAWVRRILRKAHFAGGALAILGGGLLVVFGPWLVTLWSRGKVHAGRDVLIPLALWTVLSVWGQTAAAFLNGTGRIAVQAAAAVFMAGAAFLLKWVLVGPLGPPGIVWATVTAFSVFSVIPLAWSQHRVLRHLAKGPEPFVESTSTVEVTKPITANQPGGS